jgi:cell shape-determining protein MreD
VQRPGALAKIERVVRVLIVLYLLAVCGVALLAQMILPGIFPVLNAVGFNSALVPLIVIYASLELGDERAPIVAGLAGLLLDLISSSQHLGTSVLVLFSLSALIVTQASKPESHSWPFRLLFVLVGTFCFYVMSYVLQLAETARWTWPFAVWSKITFGSLLNLFLCPIAFYLIGLPPRLCGWKPDYETQDRFYAR